MDLRRYLVSRTPKRQKHWGYEYWSPRPGNRHGSWGIGRYAKTRTHKAERRLSKEETLSRVSEAEKDSKG